MVGYLALAYVVVFVAGSVLLSFSRKAVKKNSAAAICVTLFLIALGFITTYFEPFRRADLYRQYARIINFQGVHFSEFLKVLFKDAMWGETLIYWLFSHFESVKWYPFVFTVLVVGIAVWLTEKPYHEVIPVELFTIAMMVFFAGNSLTSIFGGVRNRFVNGVIVLCLYKVTEEHKRKIPYLLIMLFACFIHVSGIATLLFSALALVLRGRKKAAFILLPVFYSTAMQIMSGIGNSTVQYFVLKMKYYFEDSYTISPKILLGYFLMLIFVLMVLWAIPKTELSDSEYKYYNIVECLALFGGGCIFAPHIMLRQTGLCCCAILPLLGRVRLDKRKTITYVLLVSGIIGIGICYIYGVLALPESYVFTLL